MSRDPYYESRRSRKASGTARRDQFGGRVRGEYNEYQEPMATAESGLRSGGLTTGGLRTGSLSTGSREPSAFDAKFGKPQKPPTVTTQAPPAPMSPALTAGGVLASTIGPAIAQAANPLGAITAAPAVSVAPAVGASMIAAGRTPVSAPAKSSAAPDAFGATRTNMNGGSERWQPSEATGSGKWVNSTSPTPIVPPGTNPGRVINPGMGGFNTEGQRLTQTVGSGGEASIEYDPRRDTGIATIPNRTPGAVRSVAVDSRYVTPGTTGVGTVSRGGSNATAGRLMDENGDHTQEIMGNLARDDAFARGPKPAPAPQMAAPAAPAGTIAASTAPTPPAPSAATPFVPSGPMTAIGTPPPPPAVTPAPPASPAYQAGADVRTGGREMVDAFTRDIAAPVSDAVRGVWSGLTGKAQPAPAPVPPMNNPQPAPTSAPSPGAKVPDFPFSYQPQAALPETVDPSSPGVAVPDGFNYRAPGPAPRPLAPPNAGPGMPATVAPSTTTPGGLPATINARTPAIESDSPVGPNVPPGVDPQEEERRRRMAKGSTRQIADPYA